MDNDYDVAIVGAGIAGCAAATHYERSGARVALIERHAFGARIISFPRFLEARAVGRAAWVNLRARPIGGTTTTTLPTPSA